MAEPKKVLRIVHCVKLNKDLPGLERQPVPGEFGKKVYDNISKEAFQMFLDYFKMIVNEYRLDLSTSETDKIFFDQMEEFLFGKGSELPEKYIPENK